VSLAYSTEPRFPPLPPPSPLECPAVALRHCCWETVELGCPGPCEAAAGTEAGCDPFVHEIILGKKSGELFCFFGPADFPFQLTRHPTTCPPPASSTRVHSTHAYLLLLWMGCCSFRRGLDVPFGGTKDDVVTRPALELPAPALASRLPPWRRCSQ